MSAGTLAAPKASVVPLDKRAAAADPASPVAPKSEDEILKPLITRFIEKLKITMPAGLDQVLDLVCSFQDENGAPAFRSIGRRHKAIAQAWATAQSEQWPQRESIAVASRKISLQHAAMNMLIDQVFYQDNEDEENQSAVFGQ